MTPQEEQLLHALIERVNSTQLQEKDPEAEALLNQSFSANPDVVYILAQTVLVQNVALDQAKAQITQLQQQIQQARQPAHATSFLGSLLGRHDPEPAPPPPQSQPVQFQPVQQPQYIPAQPQYVPMAMGQPSFLRGAMQTAAGVAAGALAFEGVEAALHGIMGHPGFGGYGWGGPGFGMGGAGFERPVEETVINNYYDQPGGSPEHHEHLDRGGLDQNTLNQGSGEQHFHESADQNAAQFTDASYNAQGDDRSGDQSNFDQGSLDDSNFGDSNLDDSDQNFDQGDSGGLDDPGGFDNGGGFDSGGSDSSFV